MKSHLANSIWSAVPFQAQPSHNFKYVLDGGALLHRITWQIGDTYEKISQDYSNYVTKKYGQAMVVFAGYRAINEGLHRSAQGRLSGTEGDVQYVYEVTDEEKIVYLQPKKQTEVSCSVGR